MKQTSIVAISLLLCILLLTGCGAKAPEGIGISCHGGEATVLEMQAGEELTGLCAVLSPADSEGTITWSSDAPDVVRVSAVNGAECTLVAEKSGSAVVTATCGGVSASVSVNIREAVPEEGPDENWEETQEEIGDEETELSDTGVALTIHGVDYSREQVTVCFADQYYSFANYYGEYALYYGLDVTAGIDGLSDQTCEYSADGTWYGYFLDTAVEYLAQMQALCDYAGENGVTLTAEDLEYVDDEMEQIAYMAELYGFDSVEGYLNEYFGSSVPVEAYREYLENSLLADKAYGAFIASLSYTPEEIKAHYAEMGYAEGENEYPVTAMRHVLIMAEADENGEYTDEAITAAHEEAVRLYEEWSAGEKTEESFAALAGTYSEDGGSVGTGGLYENIYQGQMVAGINDWLFDEGRAVGDTAVIDNNGSYVGTHIVYFVGYGELFSNLLSLDDLQYQDTEEWFTELIADYAVQPGPDYESIGR